MEDNRERRTDTLPCNGGGGLRAAAALDCARRGLTGRGLLRGPDMRAQQLELFKRLRTTVRHFELGQGRQWAACRRRGDASELSEVDRVIRQARPLRGHKEVARILGTSRQNVQNIERRALTKLIRYVRREARQLELLGGVL